MAIGAILVKIKRQYRQSGRRLTWRAKSTSWLVDPLGRDTVMDLSTGRNIRHARMDPAPLVLIGTVRRRSGAGRSVA